MIDWKQEIRDRLTGLKLEPTRETEIVEELAQHLEDRYSELLATGTTQDEASGAALADLSGHELLARELGIRLALGAQKKDIYRAILGTSGRPVAVGLLLGLAITVATWSAMTPLLQNQEFSFSAGEPIAYAATALLLASVSLTAMLIPARRATRADPMVALREE